MNVQEYLARDLIAKAVADERSRIIAELADAAGPNMARGAADDRTLSLGAAIAIVRGET